MSAHAPHAPGEVPGLDADERRTGVVGAWLWLLALPASLYLGLVAAHIPYAVVTDQVEGSPGPWWFELIVAVLGLGVTWLPVGASMLWARRAVRAGSRAAWAPLVLDVLLTLAALAVVVLSAFG